MSAPLQRDERLPCGCVIGDRIVDGERAFVMKPCKPTCRYYLYAIAETRKAGKPIEFRERL